MIPLFRERFAWLDQQRVAAGSLWEEFDLLFCQPNGRPIDPRDGWEEFKTILQAGGIRDSRVHDGRHTAGTLLMEQGVDIRTVMENPGPQSDEHRSALSPRRHADGSGGDAPHGTSPLGGREASPKGPK